MMSFIAIPLVTVTWLLVGYSLAFSGTSLGGVIGDLSHVGMAGIGPDTVHGSVPELLYATFQLSFAIITAALVSGAIADRARFAAWMVFVPLWAVLVYSVVAHWVWAPGGWLFKLGVLDYAGGLVVEIVSGASALALALVLGPRIGFKVDAMRPHNLPFVLLGVGLLWFGWFGFNAGSALAANGAAAAIFLNTLVAGCLGMLGWLSVEQIRDGRPTTFGAASGVVAGLVAITPSCGTVNTLGAAVVGIDRLRCAPQLPERGITDQCGGQHRGHRDHQGHRDRREEPDLRTGGGRGVLAHVPSATEPGGRSSSSRAAAMR